MYDDWRPVADWALPVEEAVEQELPADSDELCDMGELLRLEKLALVRRRCDMEGGETAALLPSFEACWLPRGNWFTTPADDVFRIGRMYFHYISFLHFLLLLFFFLLIFFFFLITFRVFDDGVRVGGLNLRDRVVAALTAVVCRRLLHIAQWRGQMISTGKIIGSLRGEVAIL
ncbi:hypothetical protein TYRP_008049 [Tyrophagus putrescentiae]|nr:hypothetical protein TYRP_008049 [Tyrophagus putrescentiae]